MRRIVMAVGVLLGIAGALLARSWVATITPDLLVGTWIEISITMVGKPHTMPPQRFHFRANGSFEYERAVDPGTTSRESFRARGRWKLHGNFLRCSDIVQDLGHPDFPVEWRLVADTNGTAFGIVHFAGGDGFRNAKGLYTGLFQRLPAGKQAGGQ